LIFSSFRGRLPPRGLKPSVTLFSQLSNRLLHEWVCGDDTCWPCHQSSSGLRSHPFEPSLLNPKGKAFFGHLSSWISTNCPYFAFYFWQLKTRAVWKPLFGPLRRFCFSTQRFLPWFLAAIAWLLSSFNNNGVLSPSLWTHGLFSRKPHTPRVRLGAFFSSQLRSCFTSELYPFCHVSAASLS